MTEWVFLATPGSGLVRAVSAAGAAWSVTSLLSGGTFAACATDPARPEGWYASISTYGSFPRMAPSAHVDGEANAYIFRSMNGGPWQKLGGGLPEPLDYMAYALSTDQDTPGHLYAGLSNGDVWHTADHGDSWRQLSLNLGGVQRAMIML